MTNAMAIGIGIALVSAIIADQVWLDGSALVFTARKFIAMIEWLAFWR